MRGMKHKMKRCTMVLLGALLVGAGWAKQFDHRLVPAQTKWFIHVDIDQFKKTQLGKFALRQVEKLEPQLRPLELILNMKLREDLGGVTLYGIGKEDAEVVLMVHGKFNRRQITALAETSREHRIIRLHDHVIHGWEDRKGAHYGCLVKDHTLIFSDGLKTLRGALNVLDDKIYGLGEKPIVAKATAGEHPFFIVGLVDFEALGELKADAKILEKMKAMCFVLGEANDDLQGRLLVEPKDEKTGKQILQIVKGMVAMVQILPDDNEPELWQLKQWLETLKIEMATPAIAMSFKVPVKEILNAAKVSLKLEPNSRGENKVEVEVGVEDKNKE